MTSFRTAFMLTSGLAAMIVAAPASAQETVAVADVSSEGAAITQVDGEEIIVTAQKREQVLIDVPQSITVVSGDTLDTIQATNFQDYLKLVPGLQLDQSNPGEGRLIIRGLNTGGVASTVATYLDETPFGSSTGLVNGGVLAGDFDVFDVARIEVLRGPQGTLYGASSLGGLMKFVTNAPSTSRLEARGRVSFEQTDGGDAGYRVQGMVNVPLSSTIAVRASGSYRKEGGFIDSSGDTYGTPLGTTITSDDKNNINGVKSLGLRGAILFKPSSVFDLRLSASLQNIRTKSPTVVESDPENPDEFVNGRYHQARFAEPYGDLDYRVYNALMNYDLGIGTLTSSTSFSKQNQTRRQDLTNNLSWLIELFSGVPNELVLDQNTNDKRFTQEVRLASHESDRFEWLVGGYYTHEDGLIRQEYVTLAPGTNDVITTPLGVLAEVALKSKYKEIAGFANATLHLGDRFHVDFGGRYSHNSQDAAQTGIGALAGNVPINTDLHSSDNVFTYSVAPRYEINDHASVYGRIAKGYRPGGPNVIPPDSPAGTPETFGPDRTINYELGIKAETADRRFSVDAAVYHIDWTNIQLFTVINNFGLNINGGSAKVDGVEFTGTWRPIRGLTASVNMAYTNARLADDLPPVLGAVSALDGDRLPFTPKYSLGVNADYRWALSGATEAFVGASLRSLTDQLGDYDADYLAAFGHHRKLNGYSVVDLRGGVEFGKFSIEAYAKNPLNAKGRTSTIGPNANGVPVYPNGALGTGIIRPRTVGVSLTAGL